MKPLLPALVLCLLVASCSPKSGQTSRPPNAKNAAPVDPLALVLAPHHGETQVDKDIMRAQQLIREGLKVDISLEQLGWLFIAKARASFDAGFYKLAEQCGIALEVRQPKSREALLLRGHALHNLHRFKDAESRARELVAQRGLPLDYGLLGDVLMEQGRLGDAIAVYQKMADLKPDAQALTRAAHVRWLKGDLPGAIELMQTAAEAASSHDADTTAWIFTRLAGYQLQASAHADAERSCAMALSLRPEYPPALLVRGRMLLAEDKLREASEVLRRATKLNPLPEYQWAFADALRAAGENAEALSVEAELRRHGAVADPRTFALFLATRGEKPDIAVRLAKEELNSRSDVFTHDALAWSLTAAGQLDVAQAEMERALAEGTQDARLFAHAAMIRARAGRDAEARAFIAKARTLAHLLLPSEREQFQALAGRFAGNESSTLAGTKNFSANGQ